MTKAKLDKNNIATIPGDITVYNYDAETREYLSSSEEYLARGVGIPANSCIDAPPAPREGLAVCRMTDGTGWEHLPDHRGETVYNTETGEPQEISVPGDYPDGTTTLHPSGSFDKWNGEKWITDTNAQHDAEVANAEQRRLALLSDAQNTINIWQTELQLGIISDTDKEKLISWLEYIKKLQSVDTSQGAEINWPTSPAA